MSTEKLQSNNRSTSSELNYPALVKRCAIRRNRPTSIMFKSSGFTLIEMLMTMIVAGIVATVAIPGLSSTIKNNRQTTVTNDFLADLHIARSEAIARNGRVAICPSKDNQTCSGEWSDGRLVFADINTNGEFDNGETALRASGSVKSIYILTTDFPQFLSYRPNGRVMVNDIDENSGSFTLCDQRGAVHATMITISRSGRPRAMHPTSDNELPSC